ncbi:MAG: hypothetical protein ACYYKD_05655 [Rhodospirillales bacterium]
MEKRAEENKMGLFDEKFQAAVQAVYDHAMASDNDPGRIPYEGFQKVVAGASGPGSFLAIDKEFLDLGLAHFDVGGYELTKEFFSYFEKIPASDGFVLRDHNSEPYKQAVGAVGAAIDAVSGDNEYGQRDNEDRDQRIAELKAGAELLKSNRVEVSKIEAVLIKTLAYLTGIGVAVAECAAAIEAVKALFGL